MVQCCRERWLWLVWWILSRLPCSIWTKEMGIQKNNECYFTKKNPCENWRLRENPPWGPSWCSAAWVVIRSTLANWDAVGAHRSIRKSMKDFGMENRITHCPVLWTLPGYLYFPLFFGLFYNSVIVENGYWCKWLLSIEIQTNCSQWNVIIALWIRHFCI